MAGAKLEKTRTPGIYRRGSRYTFSYRYRGRQKWATAGSLVEARRLRERINADVDRGEHREYRDASFGEAADEWIAAYQGRTDRGFREATRKEYRRHLNKAKLYFDVERRLRLAEIEPRDVRGYVTWLSQEPGRYGRPLARATIQRHLAPIKAMFSDLVEDGVLRTNPAGVRVSVGVERLEVADEKRALTRAEVESLLNAAPSPYWELFLRFMLHSGLRIGEAIELRWRDVDFGSPTTISVRRAYRDGEVNPPKSKYGVREIPVAPELAADLFRAQGGPDELVFPNGAGERHDPPSVLKRVLRPAAVQAGIEWKPAIHNLRHTCASLLFSEGKNAVQVQRWLGHHDPAFTLRTYVHLLDDGIGSADFLDDLTRGERGGKQTNPKQAEKREHSETPQTA